MARGQFISIEGLDGCGKSTQVQLLSQHLKNNGHRVLNLREPGGCSISESIRGLLLDQKNKGMDPKTELLLFVAARAQLVAEIIEPALQQGTHVVADRFGWATFAYQGYGRGLNLEVIQGLRDFTCGEAWPNHSFLLDIPLSKMEERLKKAGQAKDRMEQENSVFFEKVRRGYLNLSQRFPEKITVLDGTSAIETIHEEILRALNPILAQLT